ncbi:MAG: tryptophan--tRNA ligase [Candidatus Shikimatogenerans bostrichidophilus]|nr:MAG: tryptophan--tRNA ligase [Candidatus Shikimatogenerans bostrichidophilus]
MNKKIMTGIKSTGIPHIGNILSVIIPIKKIIKEKKKKKFFILIADLHSITNYKNNIILKNNIYKTAAVLLSFLNIKKYKNIFIYRQSNIKQINELFWFLNCFYSFNRIKLSHVYKDYIKKKKKINIGMINYPILMAADILLYKINKIIIGKDQIQHIEITRKIAKIINKKIRKKLFIIPKYIIKYNNIIPGIDGKKMSKSNNNIINIFENKNILEKQIMNIKTNNESIYSMSYNKIKNTILFKIYKIIINNNKEELINIKEKIKNKKIGFFTIKKMLYKYILFFYSKQRKKFLFFINNKNIINKILNKKLNKLIKIAKKNIFIIKNKLGLNI